MSHTAAVANDFTGLDAIAAASQLADCMARLDRRLRRDGLITPPPEAKHQLVRSFESFCALADRCEARGGGAPVKEQCRDILGAWLFRSRCWNRAFQKPRGFAGDFMLMEWIYDLETDLCADPTQPAIVNGLDHLFSTLQGTQSLWQRRRWLGTVMRREHQRRGGKLRILDVAAGGARHIRDFLSQLDDTSEVRITIADQDEAAVAYCRNRSLAAWSARVEAHARPMRDLDGRAPGTGKFDLIVAAGPLDHLDDPEARELLRVLTSWLSPDGLLAISSFHPDDRSRLTRDWLLDWPLVHRDEPACVRLLPTSLEIQAGRSENGGMTYATGRVFPAAVL